MNAFSGVQYEIRHGDQKATITDVGAGLRVRSTCSRQITDGYMEIEMRTGARSHTLIHWPNRIKSEKYMWVETDHQLGLTEPTVDGAIHGLTRAGQSELIEYDENHDSFGHTLYACSGWSSTLDCRIDYRLSDSALSVVTTATKLGAGNGTYGTGVHLYLAAETATIHSAHDHAPAVSLWADAPYPYLEMFTGDALAQPERRRKGRGAEPMTCAPNAFNSRDGLITLEPGQSHSGTCGIKPYR